jgi:DnaK suppressor protein
MKKDPPAPHHSQARGGSLQEGLSAERAGALAQIEALTREFDEVVAASKASNADDEHDPEGATIAFERQQVAALLDQARRRLADVDAAVTAVEAGTYGRCETCGRPIAAERLAARPAARTCIDCAR